MPLLHKHPVDDIELIGIPAVRDRMLHMQKLGKKVLRLESGDPSFDLPPHIFDAIDKAMRAGKTHYSQGGGIPELRDAIAAKCKEHNRLPVEGGQHALATNGATNGLFVALHSLLQPGDEVIVQDPNWTNTQDIIQMAGATPVGVMLDPKKGLRFPPDEIEKAITPRTRAIVVNTPHNPTGAVLDKATLQGIVDVAKKHDLAIVSDEAYEHLVYDDHKHISIGSLPGAEERTISIFSMSKSYAMAGLRVGYCVTPNKKLIARMNKYLRATINHINTAVQYGAVAALTLQQDATAAMLKEYTSRRELLTAGLSAVPVLHTFKPAGGFFVWCRVDEKWEGYGGVKNGFAMTDYLIDSIGCGSAPGEAFGPAGAMHVRFSYSCARSDIEGAVAALKTLFSK